MLRPERTPILDELPVGGLEEDNVLGHVLEHGHVVGVHGAVGLSQGVVAGPAIGQFGVHALLDEVVVILHLVVGEGRLPHHVGNLVHELERTPLGKLAEAGDVALAEARQGVDANDRGRRLALLPHPDDGVFDLALVELASGEEGVTQHLIGLIHEQVVEGVLKPLQVFGVVSVARQARSVGHLVMVELLQRRPPLPPEHGLLTLQSEQFLVGPRVLTLTGEIAVIIGLHGPLDALVLEAVANEGEHLVVSPLALDKDFPWRRFRLPRLQPTTTLPCLRNDRNFGLLTERLGVLLTQPCDLILLGRLAQRPYALGEMLLPLAVVIKRPPRPTILVLCRLRLALPRLTLRLQTAWGAVAVPGETAHLLQVFPENLPLSGCAENQLVDFVNQVRPVHFVGHSRLPREAQEHIDRTLVVAQELDVGVEPQGVVVGIGRDRDPRIA